MGSLMCFGLSLYKIQKKTLVYQYAGIVKRDES